MLIRFLRRPALLGAACLLLASAPSARAWGFEGHRMIASLAEQQLSRAARAEVRRLLAQEPGATLSSISTWADEHRSPASGRWHYVNFPPGHCDYQPARDCAGGACVIEALNRQTALLASRTDDAKRLRALKYVVHLVGDVHQPLHAGHAADKGGNTLQLRAFGRGSNLHALWDSGLIASQEGGAQALQQQLAPALRGGRSLGAGVLPPGRGARLLSGDAPGRRQLPRRPAGDLGGAAEAGRAPPGRAAQCEPESALGAASGV
jgi:nuclease S1